MISSEPADSCVLSVFACGKAGKPDWSSSPDPGKRLLGYLRSQRGSMGSPNSQEPGQEPILVAQRLWSPSPFAHFPGHRISDIELQFNKEILD